MWLWPAYSCGSLPLPMPSCPMSQVPGGVVARQALAGLALQTTATTGMRDLRAVEDLFGMQVPCTLHRAHS